ncbi:MAG TPA: hypothetical protein VM487_17300 [Phycisphaerae bacterium]|nr:hypothetical protein [Phycisphaerae bacterium]
MKIIGAIAVVVGCTLLSALVVSVLWGWFVVPLGLPPIHMAWAIGLSCVVGMFSREDKSNLSWESLTDGVIFSLARSGSCLFVGWVIHFWV